MKSVLKRIALFLVAFLALAVLAAEISAIVCKSTFCVRDYTVKIDGIKTDTKVVMISDLHSCQYGDDNQRLLQAIRDEQPAAIFCVGDMVNAGADDAEIRQMLSFVEDLQEIAQVYYSLGNTELQNMMDGGADVLRLVRTVGAVALLDDYVETEIGGNRVNVGFTMGHYNYTKYQWANPPDYAMEYAVGADGTPAIVLRHMPESFFLDIHDKWTGDLYLCGHTHGGLWRIPGIGGIYAPTQRFFPKYDRGYFTFDDGKYQMIINPGFGGHGWIPRIFNLPEVSVITLTGK